MEVTVIKSNRKTVAIQVDSDMRVIVRAPRRATQKHDIIEKIRNEFEFKG